MCQRVSVLVCRTKVCFYHDLARDPVFRLRQCQVASTPPLVKTITSVWGGGSPVPTYDSGDPPVICSTSPAIVKYHYIRVFLLFPCGKWSKLFPGKNLMCPYTIFKEEDLITCENPKIQPVFSKLPFQPFLGGA